MKILIFDVESTGTDSTKHTVLTLGAVAGDLDTGEIFETMEVYHKLPNEEDYNASQGAFDVHGISIEDCMSRGISTDKIRDKFTDMYFDHKCVLLGGHSTNFDIRFLCDRIFGVSIDEFTNTFTYRILDSLPLIRLFAGVEDIKAGASLKRTVKALNIDMSDVKGGYHGALYDSIATFKILCKFRRVLSDSNIVRILCA